MNIKLVAFGLLVGRLISMGFILNVLRRQVRLLKLPTQPNLRSMRWVLFGIALVIFLGNCVPLVIDALTLFVHTSRPATVSALSLSYAISSNGPAVLESVLIWLLYKMAERVMGEDE